MDELPDDLDLTDEQRRLLLEMTPDERRGAIDYTCRVREFERDMTASFRVIGAAGTARTFWSTPPLPTTPASRLSSTRS